MNNFIIVLLTVATTLATGTAVTAADNVANFFNVATSDVDTLTPSVKENSIPDKADNNDRDINSAHKNSARKKHHHNHKNMGAHNQQHKNG